MSQSEDIYDLLIIGGGINGVGIARDAAGRGLKVMLVEKDDLAQHTSSSSTKLIHGGLRYLENYDFALVAKALKEREVLLRAAPHIIWPMRFVLPHQKGQRPAWLIRMGLFLYDNFGGREILPGTKVLRRKSSEKFEPLKSTFQLAFEYSDCWVDDARLVALNAVAAKEKGAVIRTRSRCDALVRMQDMWEASIGAANGTHDKVRAKVVVNAAGPWVDELSNQAIGGQNKASVRLVKGSHIIINKKFEGSHSYFFQNGDGRIMFAIPYQEGRMTLIGTTDELYTGDRDVVEISEKEIEYLISSVNEYFIAPVERQDIVSTYAGVRPLYDDQTENVSKVTRDYVLSYDDKAGAPLLSVFGGKITTYRTLAEAVMTNLQTQFPHMSESWTKSAHLPGGDIQNADFDAYLATVSVRYPWYDERHLKRMLRAYGTRIHEIFADAQSMNDLGDVLGEGFSQVELNYLIENEFVKTAEDVLWRRSKLGLHLNSEQISILENWFKAASIH
ncbi:glycerol-3-phosphate dehydrogenase [Hirschia litorea]|uniref:Glycerol-3-phosphate dehydrogenase n=1 Tax=Hirschia litorea TaxID=1199156 RepID=A0ABW2IQ35_9PROT